MKQYLETYCQLSFLEHFFDAFPTSTNPFLLEDSGELKAFMQLSELLIKRSDLLVDKLNDLEEKAKTNPILKRLLKSSMTGGSRLYDFSKDFDFLMTDLEYFKQVNPIALHYYTCEPQLSEERYQEVGSFVNEKNNWKGKINQLSQAFSLKVHPKQELNQFKGWVILGNNKLPINAAIIADNYILKSTKSFEQNIYKIITSLLPNSLSQNTFHLTIITDKNLVNPKGKFEKVRQFLDKLNKTYSIDFGLFLTSANKPHDRDIITNYYRIHSGHSLDYFDDNGRINKSSTLDYFGLNAIPNNPHQLILTEYKRAIKYAKQDFDAFGILKNRLLT